jgi:Protein of unknown function (DUF4236)
MGFRFRKRLRIIPGIWLNLSKRGVSSVSVGRRGATLNFNKRGTRETVGLPGSGLSYQTKRVPIGQRRGSAKRPGASASPMSVLAFVLVLAAILWILAHVH